MSKIRVEKTIAALDQDGLWLEGDPGPQDPSMWEWSTADRVIECMEQSAVDVLQIDEWAAQRLLGDPHSASCFSIRDLGGRGIALPWFEGHDTGGKRAMVSVTRGQREIRIGCLQDGLGDPFTRRHGPLTGGDLLKAHILFRDALQGWTFAHSAMATGWSLMHAGWSYGRRKHALSGKDMTRCPVRLPWGDDQLEVPDGTVIHRTPVKDGYVHAFDLNAQRLAACARLALPISTCEAADPGRVLEKRSTSPQGYLRTDRGSYMTFERARIEGLGALSPAFGVVWADTVPYLDHWYMRLRDARNTLISSHTAAARSALAALKQCYLQPLGRFRSGALAEQKSDWYRPEWYDTIIGRELGLQTRRLNAIVSECATYPHNQSRPETFLAATHYDAILLWSTHSRGDGWLPPACMKVSDQAGHWKYVGSTLLKAGALEQNTVPHIIHAAQL